MVLTAHWTQRGPLREEGIAIGGEDYVRRDQCAENISFDSGRRPCSISSGSRYRPGLMEQITGEVQKGLSISLILWIDRSALGEMSGPWE